MNLYHILNVQQDATRQEIKESYRKLVIQHHPDKGGNSNLFEIITSAYEILHNPESRKEYDESILIKKYSNGHSSLKAAFTLENEKPVTELTKEDIERFEKFLNKEQVPEPISVEKTTSLLKDLELSREVQEIECTHNNLFENEKFSLEKFNALFDLNKQNVMSNSLIPHSGAPVEWNTFDSSNECPFDASNFDQDPIISDSTSDLISNYVTQHNHIDKDYNDLLEARMKEYNMQTEKLNTIPINEFEMVQNFFHEQALKDAQVPLLHL